MIAVEDVELEVERGEILALLGPSGSGKTTILRMVAGFDAPDAGDILLNGRSVRGVPPEARGVGIVFQDLALFPHLNVAGNVAFGLRGRSPDERTRRLGEVLRLVGIHHLAERYPDQLSGGQQQRVALARALAPAPDIVLL